MAALSHSFDGDEDQNCTVVRGGRVLFKGLSRLSSLSIAAAPGDGKAHSQGQSTARQSCGVGALIPSGSGEDVRSRSQPELKVRGAGTAASVE